MGFVVVGLVACGGGGGNGGNGGNEPTSISVTPGAVMVAAGEMADVTASYVLKDGTSMSAADVTWVVGDASIATVSPGAGGHATVHGVKMGTTMVMVTGQGAAGAVMVTVGPAVLRSIAITPPVPSVAAGISAQLKATGSYSDATTADLSAMVTWSSSATGVATVSSVGLMKGVAVGGATITAKLGTITATANITVTAALLTSIEVTPTNSSLALGTTQQLTATGVFTDSTTQDLTAQVAWTSDATSQVTVSAGGLATAAAIGGANITATQGTISGSTRVTATAARLVSIAITPTTPSVALGLTLQLAATGTFTDNTTQDLTAQVTWASGSTTTATVDATGLVHTNNAGVSMITASLGTVTGSTLLTVTAAVLESIAVTPTNPSVPRGRTQQFTAIGTFSDRTTQDLTAQVMWASSDMTVAQISNVAGSQGLATTISAGATTVSASTGLITGSTQLTVTAAVLDSIEVTPTNPNVPLGRTQQFTAVGTFSDTTTLDLTTQVAWSSDTPGNATISNAVGSQGLATTVAVGTATISATLSGVSGLSTLTVSGAVLESISVTPTTPTVPRGLTQQFTAIGTFSDTTTLDLTAQVTWSSGTTTVATISNAAGSEGLANAVQVGSSTITATLDTVSGSTDLTVTAAVLQSIQVTPIDPTVPAGTTPQFTATGTFSDTTTQDLTAQVTWSSSVTTVATISNAPGSEGLATTLIPGATVIKAALGTISGTTTLTVSNAVVVSIQVTPVNPSLAVGLSLNFTATGTFSDATTQDLTTQVTWASTNPAVATISNASGSEGLATGVAVGATTIKATFGAVTGSTTLNVTPAVLESIAVTPVDASVAKGRSQQYTAIGTFSDATTQDLTTQVTWDSSATAVAQISNAAGSEGLATTLTVGTTTISATLGTVSGSTNLTVTSAVLVSIAVTPVNPSVASGRSQQFTAVGTFSDATTQDLTTQVTWASGNTTIAQISNAAGSEGLATAKLPGTTTISATLTGVTGTTNITVTAAVLESITVAPATASVIPGGTQQYTATGHFSDLTSLDLTATVTWASGNTAIARVSNAAGSNGQANGITVGSTTITATSGSVVGSAAIVVLGPSVVATSPGDATSDARTATPIVITFNQGMAPATLTTQTTAGACSGTIQLSRDNFATCVGFATAAPVMSVGNTVATAIPAPKLLLFTTYRIRVRGTVTNTGGSPMGADFTQATGFRTAGACTARVVISQVYGGGGSAGATFRSDFIELHNVGATTASLAGTAVQYAASNGTGVWQVTALPASAQIQPGGYFLIAEFLGTSGSVLPTPDFTGGIAMGATAGKVAFTSNTTALNGQCPGGAAINDLVGYGAANCSEGTPTPALVATTAALRNDGGCDDTNANSADFTVGTPVPRNSTVTANECSCTGSTTPFTAGFAADNVSFPDDDAVSLP